MAAQDYFGVVQQLYVSYFGRPADPNGLQSFASQLDAIGAPKDFKALQAAVQADVAGSSALSQLVNSFNSSPESAALYGTDNSLAGMQKFVAAIYQNVLGREADLAGFNFWVNALTSGALTKANAAAAITQGALDNTSDQGKIDALTVQNKLSVATSFTTALDTPSELIAFSGDAAAAAARSLLSSVNSSTDLPAFQANINTAIVNIVNGSVPGETKSLTSGVDALVGTTGNDIFNALSVKADGTPGSTLGDFDTIDGGAGRDTLNIYTDGTINGALGANSTITSVETINIYNSGAAAATGLTDASKFVGVTELWQIGKAANVTNLQSTTTAGFRSLAVSTVGVAAADAAASATVALDKVAEGSTVNVTSGAEGTLAAVTLKGTVLDTNADSKVGNTNLTVTVGKDVQTLTVNTAVATNLDVVNNGEALTTINAAGSTGAITYAGASTDVASITTGSGKDDVTIVTVTAKDVASTTANEAVNAVVNTGAGDDKITVNVTGDGIVTVNAGEGNDTVHIAGRGTALLDINLGAGDDIFTSDVAIGANDKIDAGAGFDTLLLNLVGSANVGAFSNFDAFDAKDLAKALDIDILTQKNTVTEIITTGSVGAGASLLNVGAGVGYRITADTDTDALSITQKVAGDLTVTLDIDETGTTAATTAADAASGAVTATNATGVKAVFDSSFVGAAKDATDNTASLSIDAVAAKSISVVSGGENASNVLTVTAGAPLTTITVTGSSELTIAGVTGATKLLTIDASAATGGLNASLASVIDGGSIKLGSGADIITVTNASTVGGVESIVGFEKAAAVAVSTVAGEVTAKAAAIADADQLLLAGATVANATTGLTGGDVNANGVLTFTGSGPSTLADAAAIAGLAAETAGEALVFEYLGNSYVFVQGATDTLVQLAGVTGVKNFAETGTDHFFIV